MTDVVIQAEALGKKYTIDHQAERGHYLALRNVQVRMCSSVSCANVNAKAQRCKVFHICHSTNLLRSKPIIQDNELEEI